MNLNLEITVVEKTGRFGEGLAYETKLDVHLLHMKSNGMTIQPNDSQDFVKWLSFNPHVWDNIDFKLGSVRDFDFVPRRIFGIYLKETCKG